MQLQLSLPAHAFPDTIARLQMHAAQHRKRANLPTILLSSSCRGRGCLEEETEAMPLLEPFVASPCLQAQQLDCTAGNQAVVLLHCYSRRVIRCDKSGKLSNALMKTRKVSCKDFATLVVPPESQYIALWLTISCVSCAGAAAGHGGCESGCS